MTEDMKPSDRSVADLQEAAEARRERQDQQDPSGHGMQVTPSQQQHIAESSDESPSAAAVVDEDTLETLKGEKDR